MHRHHRHVTLSSHFFGVAGLLCHAATYRAWPRDVQQAVRDAAQEAGAAQRALAAAEDGEVLRDIPPSSVSGAGASSTSDRWRA